MFKLIPIFLLAAVTLSAPNPAALPQDPPLPVSTPDVTGDLPTNAPPADNSAPPRCKVNMEYVDTWSEAPGSRWRYKITWSDNTTALSEYPVADVLLAMRTPGCCASVDNPQAWQDGNSIYFDFGEVVQPLGKGKAMCVNSLTQQELATEWNCDQGFGEHADIRCA